MVYLGRIVCRGICYTSCIFNTEQLYCQFFVSLFPRRDTLQNNIFAKCPLCRAMKHCYTIFIVNSMIFLPPLCSQELVLAGVPPFVAVLPISTFDLPQNAEGAIYLGNRFVIPPSLIWVHIIELPDFPDGPMRQSTVMASKAKFMCFISVAMYFCRQHIPTIQREINFLQREINF